VSTRTTLRRSAALPAAALLLLLALAPAGAGGGLTLSTPFPGVSVAPSTDVSFDITIGAAANTRVALSVSGTPDGVAGSSSTPSRPMRPAPRPSS
jgi:hypothetical protein